MVKSNNSAHEYIRNSNELYFQTESLNHCFSARPKYVALPNVPPSPNNRAGKYLKF